MLLAGIFFSMVIIPLLMFLFTLTHIIYDLLYKKGSKVSSKGVGFKTIMTANATEMIQKKSLDV